MRVMKFGGTSVGSPDRIAGVLRLVAEASADRPVLVVVSAFGGVTNGLIEASRKALKGSLDWKADLEAIAQRHAAAASALAADEEHASLGTGIGRAKSELEDLLRGVSLIKECTHRTLDGIVSFGEYLSALIVAAAFRAQGRPANAIDARTLVVTDAGFGAARVNFEATGARIREWWKRETALPVVTGFIAATESGETTTLGRGGSDYTAAIFGAALEAEAIEIWTDVDGVMSADPRIVPTAFSMNSLRYDELMELSHFGAKVVYPPTVHPARAKHIPLVIRNTLNPAFPGTWIREEAPPAPAGVRGVASISSVALLRLEGDGMVGVPGIAMRLFGALARQSVSVILISQASSEHSICFAIEPSAVARARESIAAEFALERQAGLIDDLVVEADASVIAVVGAAMRETPGSAGRIFGVLGEAHVNVRAISQGSSELNISCVVGRDDEKRAVNAIHEAFFADHRTVSVFIAGLGRVGRVLVEQMAAQAEGLRARAGLRLEIDGASTSRHTLIRASGLSGEGLRGAVESEGTPADLDALVQAAISSRRSSAVFVDCTDSDETTRHYARLLDSGVHVVSANKRPFGGDLAIYKTLKAGRRRGRGALFHETTVGAALPVVGTLSDLVRTGDRIRRIEGALSGTLGFLMTKVADGVAFSVALREAQALGYTEPNPREDLSGSDVARKILILAREAGMPIEASAVERQSLLPGPEWDLLPIDLFWKRIPELDAGIERRAAEASLDGGRLCYLASVVDGVAEVGLRRVERTSPFASVRGGDNMVAFWTDRYPESPLVIRGPGAGPEVTASGVFADIIRAASLAR
ncbi:MAG: bifunctional aspartate kinase/homoserine dehydrogenase I [Vicinamibacteria bacterium]|nr:bifunctional aspartate kinase/homoserine dehydrogenase I [Vicinamibacteria bacterium]